MNGLDVSTDVDDVITDELDVFNDVHDVFRDVHGVHVSANDFTEVYVDVYDVSMSSVKKEMKEMTMVVGLMMSML